MANLKVKPLEWFMKTDHEELESMGYTQCAPVVGRDGYFCQGNSVWFEYGGKAYTAYPTSNRSHARRHFCYDLDTNDGAILTQRELSAMQEILCITRDANVRKVLRQRLALHSNAVDARETRRNIRRVMRRFAAD